MAFGCAPLTVPQAKQWELCLQRTAAAVSDSTFELCVKSRACGKAITTLWRSGRKLPTGNTPKSPYSIILKKARRKLLWLCLSLKCPFAGARFGEHDERWQYEFRLLLFPADYPPRTTKLLSVPIYRGFHWTPACLVRSSSFLKVQLENVYLLWTCLGIYMAMWVLGWSSQCAERSSWPWHLVESNKRSRNKIKNTGI